MDNKTLLNFNYQLHSDEQELYLHVFNVSNVNCTLACVKTESVCMNITSDI